MAEACACPQCRIRGLLRLDDAIAPHQRVQAVDALIAVLGGELAHFGPADVASAFQAIVRLRNERMEKLAAAHQGSSLATMEAAGRG